MKPILKIETPSSFPSEELQAMTESLKNTDVAKDYHIITVIGTTDYYNFEIVTASDINLHKSSNFSIDANQFVQNRGKIV